MMFKLSTISELRDDGRVMIDKDTRKAGEMKPGDMLQLEITIVKRVAEVKI
jgi:bifunctional DNA-binding transcriptional regulator/antitoxin component of YhaV-PrlF toxin-antitoxin module